jgi:hypothetical protein
MNPESKTLLSALDSLHGRAGFSSAGASPFFFPDLTVEGLGEIAFPLSAQQAAAFTKLAEAAPYGKGMETRHDESVRKCWQLDAKHFSFKSPAWRKFLNATLDQIRTDLGIVDKIAAKPYKLLLYGPGGHFKAHRDTEKIDAMFGTLIVALPSKHAGGQLHIRHGGEQTTVDFSVEKHARDFQYAAFFADCEHEVVPVISGHRFCAVFNLVLEEGDPALLNLTARDHASPLAALLTRIVRQQTPGTPTVILLQHQYTEANFSIRKLKGNDRQRAAALFAASESAGLSARFALATLYQMGELEDGYDYGSRYRRSSRSDDDADNGTMGEIYEESFELDHWRDGNDRKLAMGGFPISMEEAITAEDFSKIDPDEKAGEGYTGNAGCTMEYWYRRAAIVLWPQGCDEEILCARNLRDACESLLALSTGKKTGGGTPFDKLARAAITVLSTSEDPRHHGYGNIDKDAQLPVSLVPLALARAKRSDLLDKLVASLPASRLATCPQVVWQELFAAFEPDQFSSVIKEWLPQSENFRDALFALLAALLQRRGKDPWVARIAAALARLKPKEISKWKNAESRDPVPHGDLAQSRILFHASRELEKKNDIAAALGFLKSDASLAAVRTLIGPLFTETRKSSLKRPAEGAVAKELLAFAIKILTEETARPLLPYPDWRRPCPPPPKETYPHFRGHRDGQSSVLDEITAFMADPAARELAIRRREDERTKAETYIRHHFLDLDCKTIRQGTPHTLLCTKNDRSHQHALEWRQKDEAMLRKLKDL